jgi:hypothetical protein
MATFRHPDLGEFPFKRRQLLNVEAMLLETVTGQKTKTIIQSFNEDFGPLGVTAFLWLAMHRAGHHVKYDELVFDMGLLEYDLSDEVTDAKAKALEAEQPDPSAAADEAAPPPSSARKTTAGSKKK